MEGLFSLLLSAALFYVMMRFGCGAHMVTAASTVDLVCGMAVDPDKGYTKVHDGRAYRFCSRACLDKFESVPHFALRGERQSRESVRRAA